MDEYLKEREAVLPQLQEAIREALHTLPSETKQKLASNMPCEIA
jgi:hypothetical protein